MRSFWRWCVSCDGWWFTAGSLAGQAQLFFLQGRWELGFCFVAASCLSICKAESKL